MLSNRRQLMSSVFVSLVLLLLLLGVGFLWKEEGGRELGRREDGEREDGGNGAKIEQKREKQVSTHINCTYKTIPQQANCHR
jgi:hypothetical protein